MRQMPPSNKSAASRLVSKAAKTLSFIAQFPVGIGLKLAEQGQDQNYDEDETDNSRRTVAPRPAMAPRWKSTD